MQKRIRVLIADDHLMVRKGLRLMLEEDDESIELVGDAADGASALTLIEQLQPDVVLMDVRMPGMDGITALQHIRSSWSQIAVIILTTYDEDDLLVRALQAGACGYLLKDTPLEKLLRAIHTAARGEMLLQPDVMARVLAHTHQETRTPPPLPGRGGLTRRERDVLSGIARGERSKEVAARLGITERTVRAYLASIYTKLDVDSRSSAVAVAMERGLLSLRQE
ncbi:MAG: response regulator transcription factor [Ktedonobacteraceae bacterium]|nr:response regulator transcription factor [Ktedonobacteraceae bacterium]